MFGQDFGLLCLKNNNVRRRVPKSGIEEVFPAANMHKACRRALDRYDDGRVYIYIYTYISDQYFIVSQCQTCDADNLQILRTLTNHLSNGLYVHVILTLGIWVYPRVPAKNPWAGPGC